VRRCHDALVTTVTVADAMSTVANVGAITSDSGSVNDRATAILEELRKLVPFDAAEIVSINPITEESVQIASQGYTQQVLDDLHSPQFHDIMQALNLPNTGKPVRMRDLPGDPMDNWAVADVLLPAGYAEGMTMCLRTPDGRFTGVINLSTLSTEHPSDIARDAIAHLCATLGNLVDPMQSGKWISMLLGAGSMAIGLNSTGETVSIPGLAGHKLLQSGTDLVQVAQKSAVHNSWGSFVWPDEEDWFRVRVVPCKGEQAISTVVSLDAIDIGPLTRRELEVLTLAAEGLSNGEISDALVISARTVTTHVEHILDKLDAPNRAAAASYALREGYILGKVDRHDR
jgi:DNA-binding CsgD family transcriptional regulator